MYVCTVEICNYNSDVVFIYEQLFVDSLLVHNDVFGDNSITTNWKFQLGRTEENSINRFRQSSVSVFFIFI